MTQTCATQDCPNAASQYFESGGVGSHYCAECAKKIPSIYAATPPQPEAVEGEGMETVAWPLSGYAPGNYECPCYTCGRTFTGGDKRATECLPCAVEATKRLLSQKDAEIRAANDMTAAAVEDYNAALARIAELEGERRDMHRRAQKAEAVAQVTLAYLQHWIDYFKANPRAPNKSDRYLFMWCVRDAKRLGEKAAARALLSPETVEGER